MSDWWTDAGKYMHRQSSFPGLDKLVKGVYDAGVDEATTRTGDHSATNSYTQRKVKRVGRWNFTTDENGHRNYPSGLLPETVDAMNTLTDEEIAQLKVWHDNVTSEFVCVGFEMNGKVTKWADPRRALAIGAMEKQIRWEEKNGR